MLFCFPGRAERGTRSHDIQAQLCSQCPHSSGRRVADRHRLVACATDPISHSYELSGLVVLPVLCVWIFLSLGQLCLGQAPSPTNHSLLGFSPDTAMKERALET